MTPERIEEWRQFVKWNSHLDWSTLGAPPTPFFITVEATDDPIVVLWAQQAMYFITRGDRMGDVIAISGWLALLSERLDALELRDG